MNIDELQDEVKEAVLDRYRLINIEHIDWWDYTIDYIKEIGKLIGIDIDKVYFSGFSSQGDGACFEGDYEYRKQSVSLVFGRAPKDEELIKIAKNLQELQRRFFYQLYARVKQRGHYMHEMCTDIDVSGNEDFSWEVHNDAEDGIIEFLRDFMRWSYRILEADYEGLTSDKQVEETLKINEYSFTSEGEDM